MRRFFANSEQIGDGEIRLTEEESKHLHRVLRLQAGEKVEIFDGKGKLYQTEIKTISKKNCILTILSEDDGRMEAPKLSLAVAPTKNLNRWEWFLEKAAEIGVLKISPIICEQSERKVLKTERQERILREAIKQSRRLLVPQLDELKSFEVFIDSTADFKGEKFIAHCEKGDKKLLKSLHHAGRKVLILIGPEGDFSPNEIKIAEKAGFQAISLGESRLRTETAAIVACHSINFIDE